MNPSTEALPKGFSYAGIHAGLKKNPTDLDLACIVSEVPCAAAGVFTKNHMPGEPVKLSRKRLENGKLQAVIINSRISNVATGQAGYDRAVGICKVLANQLKISEDLTTICSTGVIGRPYPQAVIEIAIPTLLKSRGESQEHFINAAKAIMTTDTVHKAKSVRVGPASISIMAKGAGMICPNMATMLVFICTDARIEPADLKGMLKDAVDFSFNRISIDFDTSTSDSCIIMANGQAGEVDQGLFREALKQLCLETAKDIVLDGEGVDKLIVSAIHGATTQAMADAVARSVINSPLVKTMITGADPNWGRLIMAIGKVDGEPGLAGVMPSISICSQQVMVRGEPVPHDLDKISSTMKQERDILININLHKGNYETCHYGGNLTRAYVDINAHYTT